MIKAIYFDIDGTLIDIKAAQNKACLFLYRYGHFEDAVGVQSFVSAWDALTEYHYDFYTRKEITYEEQRRRRITGLYGKYNRQCTTDPLDVYELYLREFENSWGIYEDVRPCLDALTGAGYSLGIITNGDRAQQAQKLAKTNIAQYFWDIIAGSDYSFSKPDRRLFERACRNSSLNYQQLCYIGDDIAKDIIPCQELGIKSILIDRNNDSQNERVSLKANSLVEVQQILQPSTAI